MDFGEAFQQTTPEGAHEYRNVRRNIRREWGLISMKKSQSNIFNIITTIVLGIIAIGIVLLQLYTVNPETTKLELALLNVLQFIFSAVFSIFLARVTFQNEFIKSQKRFAIAAYRRMTELDKSVLNLIGKINEKMKINSDLNSDFEVLLVITDGIKQSIGSSIADWGDIIGDEIETLEEINKLILERERILSINGKGNITGDDGKTDNKQIEIDQYNKKLMDLMSSLPETIKIQIKEQHKEVTSNNLDEQIKINLGTILGEIKRNGYLVLSGFWTKEEKYQIGRDIQDFKIGDKVYVALTKKDKDERGPINLIDSEETTIGRIINTQRSSYGAFYHALQRYFNTDLIEAEIMDIEEKIGLSGRRKFKVKITEAFNVGDPVKYSA
ncbi:hypothetical protein J2T18_001016 [Paenibacillus polymyxa]|uniref:hypothetical protein n=1 Tax=Paenibacillus polymyxa TaxID=1406 RepID=UPI0027912469|nr:hypothetical protein [Paenibacillus polymyxa]MDQ0046744.1 hypothetical protein [Paenibacillus polymyxa]